MTKEKLSQLSWLKLEIQELSTRIRKIEHALSGKASRVDGMRWAGKVSNPIGDLVPELTTLKEQLVQSRERAMSECSELQDFINTIDDSQARLIFTLRYQDSLSWHQVAWRLGGNTADSVRMTHNRYLAKLADVNV